MLHGVDELSAAPYRAAPPLPPDPYVAAWADLRRRRMVALALFLLFLPAMAIATCFLRGRQLTDVFWPLAMICLIARLRATLFPCPRCGGSFGFKPFTRSRAILQRNCLHCGIAVGTPAPPPTRIGSRQ
jgi:hypothetical protein